VFGKGDVCRHRRQSRARFLAVCPKDGRCEGNGCGHEQEAAEGQLETDGSTRHFANLLVREELF
jgi:hypothetical protein